MALQKEPAKERRPAKARHARKRWQRHYALRPLAVLYETYKANWPGLGTVLLCREHAGLLGGIPVLDTDHYSALELCCFVCERVLTRSNKEAA